MFPRKSQLVSIARAEKPADLLLKNARIVNVFNGRVESGDIAIAGERIAGIGEYSQAKHILDLKERFLAPGLIDGHTHPESSMLSPGEYARAVVPRGTSAIVTDLHEIANVCGLAGIDCILDCAGSLPFEFFLMAPSCVPSSHLETSGAVIGVKEIRRLLRRKDCLGLGEVMNYPAVIRGDPSILAKIDLARGKVIDGHAPGITGKELNAYISAGIRSDHESISLKEAEEKLQRGLRIMVREGSSEKNLADLMPLINDKTYKRCCFVVDDRSCSDLLKEGGIDAVARKAIRLGLDPVRAIQLATINTADYFGLREIGAIAPGYLANLIVINDLTELGIDSVFHRGVKVAEGGKPLFAPGYCDLKGLDNTINIRPFNLKDLKLPAKGGTHPVIELVPGQIITRKTEEKIKTVDSFIGQDIDRDILKLIVVERHKATGNIGKGLVKGFGLKSGALASSIAHDSHNIIAVGASDEDILAAVKAIKRMQGGLVVIDKGRVVAELALPLAGLLSAKPAEEVAIQTELLERGARELGCSLPFPFAILSFLALPVIPELRLTDLGLVHVRDTETHFVWEAN